MKIKAKILVIDDDADMRGLISLSLRKNGHKITTAGSWKDVTNRITKASSEGTPFDVIILDIMMPDRDGYDVLRMLKVILYPMPPVIMLTALSGIDDAVKALELGAVKYLTKPIAPEKLHKTVREVLSGMSRSRF